MTKPPGGIRPHGKPAPLHGAQQEGKKNSKTLFPAFLLSFLNRFLNSFDSAQE
jgi:hypothetical protein